MNWGGVIAVGLLLFMAYNAFNKTLENLRDSASNTFPGMIFGVRSVEGEKASEWIKDCLLLYKSYRDWIWQKFFVDVTSGVYTVDRLGDIEAADIAKDIIKANTVIFGEGAFDRLVSRGLAFVGSKYADNPSDALAAMKRVRNQIQLLEVTEWYYVETYEALGRGKDLAIGLQWLPDRHMIELQKYLKDLPTGVKRSGVELDKLPKP